MQELTFEQVELVSGGYLQIPDTLQDFFQPTGGFWQLNSTAGFVDNNGGQYKSPSEGHSESSFTPSEKGFIVAFATYLGTTFGNPFGVAAAAFVATAMAETGKSGGHYEPSVPDYMAP